MRLTKLAEPIGDERWRCGVCQWRCELAPGAFGRCGVRQGQADGIAALADGLISAAQMGPIEDHRLWHLLPGSPVLTVGSWGYALPADQRASKYAQIPADESQRRQLPPERAAQVALDRLCRGVVWAYSDPAVAQEYISDLVLLSRASSRYTALITSGYMTLEALDSYGLYLDAIGLELRAFDDAAYARLTGLEHWRGVLEVAVRAKEHWRCHIEVTTRVHPGVNDDSEQMTKLVTWLRDTLGPQTAWHVLPGDAGAAASAAVARARRIGHELGLQYIYGPEAHQTTVCPACGALLIERGPDGVRVVGLEGGACSACGHASGIRTSIFKK